MVIAKRIFEEISSMTMQCSKYQLTKRQALSQIDLIQLQRQCNFQKARNEVTRPEKSILMKSNSQKMQYQKACNEMINRMKTRHSSRLYSNRIPLKRRKPHRSQKVTDHCRKKC